MAFMRSWIMVACLATGSSWLPGVMGGWHIEKIENDRNFETTHEVDYTPEASADKIDWSTFPGAENLAVKDGFNMFSGYINVDQANGRNIFYWFMEAQENAADAPVILWTNGGPGCSGMLGLLTEHGPFQVRDGGKTLVDNYYSWNKLANMLYVEIPSGVGFSYSDTPSDYKTGDDKTATDNYWLVQGWLDRFPQYRRNAFHISSESYGGHYMPQLAEEILTRNDKVKKDGSAPVINFSGFLVGNPYTDAGSNQVAQYDTYWGDQLLPKFAYDKWRKTCVSETDGSYLGRLHATDSYRCDKLEADLEGYVGNLNPYAMDYPVCTGEGNDGGTGTVAHAQRMTMRDHHLRALAGNEQEMGASHVAATSYDPCAEDDTIPYLNRDDVQQALRVREGTVWEQCSTQVRYKTTDMLRPMMPYYQRLLNDYDIPILVFSGDDDAVCATEGTQWWIYDLGFDVDRSCTWKTWEQAGQVAGYQTRFQGVKLAFVTVHTAGHEVPAYQPARALELLGRYLDGSWWEREGEQGVAGEPRAVSA